MSTTRANFRRPLTPEQVRLRKRFMRKQKAQNFFVTVTVIPVIIITSFAAVAIALLAVLAPVAAVVAIVVGIIDILTNGFSWWSVAWIAVGALFLSRTKVTFNK